MGAPSVLGKKLTIHILNTANIHVEVTTGEGATVKLQLPPTATVMMVKQEVERELGIRPRDACVFSINKAHTEKLQDEETVESLLVGEEAKLELWLLVKQADMQQVVVSELTAKPSMILGDGTPGDGDKQLSSLLILIGSLPAKWQFIASRSATSALERWSASSAKKARARDSLIAQVEEETPGSRHSGGA
jgi:hypothetical protein